MTPIKETDRTIRITKQTFTYDAENKLTDSRVERLGMKALTEPSVTTYHYEYDQNGNRTLVEIKDDNLTMESTTYEYDRLNKMIRSREVTASGLYIYEYKYDDNGNLIQEDRHRAYELNTNQYQNIRRYEYTKDNKLEAIYSGNTLLVAYTYDGDGTITSTLDRDLDFNQNLNINDREYLNRLTANQRQLINKINPSDTILYELTEYVLERNQEYSQVLMQRDGAGFLSTTYTYGNQRINTESINNLSGIYTYDGRGSVSSVIGGWGDFRATYWYDGLGNVKSQIHGYGAFGSGKRYFGYNAEQYNPVTGNQNLRARQVNIRRQRFLTEDTYLGTQTDILSINRYIYANDNPLKFKDPLGFASYIGAMYLNNEKGAFGKGHTALLLIEDDGTAEFYSYEGERDLVNVVKGNNVPGYLSTVVDENGFRTNINVNDFFDSNTWNKKNIGNGISEDWSISGNDSISRPFDKYVKTEFGTKVVSKDYYTHGIYIPITNEEGKAMHSKAIQIRDNPGWYNLYNHNCNQVVQIILSAGGKDFAPISFDWMGTIPNNVRDNLMLAIKYSSNPENVTIANLSNTYTDLAYTSYIGWICGKIGDFQFVDGCVIKI